MSNSADTSLQEKPALTREEVQQWTEEAFGELLKKTQEQYLQDRLEDHRRTLLTIIGEDCPSIANTCADLSQLEQRVDGYFVFLQGGMQSEREASLISAEIREYSGVVRRIRRVFHTSKKELKTTSVDQDLSIIRKEGAKQPEVEVIDGKKTILSHKRFHEILRPFLADDKGQMWAPSSKKALAAFRLPLGAPKIMIANERFFDGLQYLFLDIPREGLHDLSYVHHFRIGIEALLDEMGRMLIGGCQPYAQEYRDRCLRAVQTLEQIIAHEYALQGEQHQSEAFVWKSSFLKIGNVASSKYPMDVETEEKMLEFLDTYPGDLFNKAKREFFDSQKQKILLMPPKISRVRFDEFDKEMKNDFVAYSELLTTYVVPHLGELIAAKLCENYRRADLDLRLGVQARFDQTEEDPHGLFTLLGDSPTTEIADAKDGIESIRMLQPTIGKVEFQVLHGRINRDLLATYPQGEADLFEEFSRAHMESFTVHWMRERIKFQTELGALFDQLPPIVSIKRFQQFMADARQKFVPFERVYLSVDESSVKKSLQFYYDLLDSLESTTQKVFALQLPSGAPLSLEESEEISRDDVCKEICDADRKSDAVVHSALGIEEGIDTLFEDEINKACLNLPEQIKSVSDLENIIYWLIGRLEATNKTFYGISTKPEFDWIREINRAQYEHALHRICTRLNFHGVDGKINTRRLLSSLPKSANSDNARNLSRTELAKELSAELLIAESRVSAMGLKQSPLKVKTDSEQFLSERKEYENFLRDFSLLAMGFTKKNPKKKLGKKERSKNKRRDKKGGKRNPQPGQPIGQNVLAEYFAKLKNALTQYFERWCPEEIVSSGPLIGLSSFLMEFCYQSRLDLEAKGITSEDVIWRVMTTINQAHVPILDWANTLLETQESSEESSDTIKEESSQTLHTEISSTVAAAITKCDWLDGSFLQEIVQKACKAAESTLPAKLQAKHFDREMLLRVIWRFNRIAAALCHGHTAHGPLRTVKEYQHFFGSLGGLVDMIKGDAEDKHKSEVNIFLTEQLLGARKNLEIKLQHEEETRTMKNSLVELHVEVQQPEQVRVFILSFVQDLFAQKMKQFFFSCIAPKTDTETIKRIGEGISLIYKKLLTALSERISTSCSSADNGVPTMSQLSQRMSEVVAETEVSKINLPVGTEERFKVQVLQFLVREFGTQKLPSILFAGYVAGCVTDDPFVAIEAEVSAILRSRANDEIAGLRQVTHTKHAQARETLHSMEIVLGQAQEPRISNLNEFIVALGALCSSLYPEYGDSSVTEDDQSGIRSLRRILATLYDQSQDSTDLDRQVTASKALIQFSDTLAGLRNSISLPDDVHHDS